MSAAKKQSDETPDPKKPDDLFSEIDSYQEKITEDWESTKAAYQSKVNQILDDFIKDKTKQADENFSILLPETDKKTSKVNDLLSRAGKVLRSAEDKVRTLTYKNPSVVNIDWGPAVDSSVGRTAKRWIGLAALVLLAVAAYLFWSTTGAVTKLPYAHPSGLTVKGDRVYIADWFRKSLYVHANRRGLPLLSVENMPNDFLNGMALTDRQIWSVNSFKSEFLEHEMTAEHPVVNRVAAPGSAAVGMTFDGTDLWSMDDQEKALYRFQKNDPSEVKEIYKFDGVSPLAFFVGKGRVWVLGKKSRQLLEYRLEDPLRLLARYDLDPLLKGATAAGVALDGSHVLLLTDNPSQVLRLSMRKLNRFREERRL